MPVYGAREIRDAGMNASCRYRPLAQAGFSLGACHGRWLLHGPIFRILTWSTLGLPMMDHSTRRSSLIGKSLAMPYSSLHPFPRSTPSAGAAGIRAFPPPERA